MFITNKRKYFVPSLLLFICSILMIGQSTKAKSDNNLLGAKVERYVNEVVEEVKSTSTYDLWSYSANVSPVSEFFDYEGNYNTIYESEKLITLVKYSEGFDNTETYSITKPYPLYGGAITDLKGNYYVVYGQDNDTDNEGALVISVVKYNSDFEYITEVKYLGNETAHYLLFSYAREMYNGHQSNHVIYINTEAMTKINHAGNYTSHSFDQRVMVTDSGDYLFVDHGDAFDRGFKISSVQKGSTDIWDTLGYVSFHFREGANRDYGYNETYAQLGGIAEISTGYVLAGASEKTLSVEPAPTSRNYCGYSEARNLFIQILDKNFMYLNGENMR